MYSTVKFPLQKDTNIVGSTILYYNKYLSPFAKNYRSKDI